MWLGRKLGKGLAPPDWLSVNLTLRCNLSCVMCTTCYDAPELSTREVLDLIDQAAAWGVKVFNPLGGEPFVRTDLEDILAHAARRDLHTSLTTNGTLIHKGRAARVAAIPADKLHLNISIDGLEATHDRVRGAGTFARTLAGYRMLRTADAAVGNLHRKITANVLLHGANLEEYERLLDRLLVEGFSGVQVLHLFRNRADPTAGGLWFQPEQLPALEELCSRLSGHPLVVNPEALPKVVRYYRDGLAPLEAPCWAGWKELYVNADGGAIMCDGKLDFLAGRFGSVRERTLRELWASPELAARRAVVKQCTTPCIQACYLRPSSDSAAGILKNAAAEVTRPARARVLRALPTRTVEVPLTLEVCDVPDDPAHPRARLLFARSPISLGECLADPTRLNEARDRGYIDFGRGFLGAGLAKRIADGIAEARLRFPAVHLTWRGEPFLHPALAEVVAAVRTIGPVVITSSGALLTGERPAWLDGVDLWVGAERWGARRGRPTVSGPAISWDGRVTADVRDVALARKVGDVLREPFGRIWERVG